MKRMLLAWSLVGCLAAILSPPATAGSELDQIIAATNSAAGIKLEPMAVVGDHIFLRRVYVDLIGRIPTEAEIREFASWPAAERRERLVNQLLGDERFADRWTIFYADMLRLRSQASGGAALIAYVHNAVKTGMPYDEMCRRLIATNGKANKVPEAGFILSDDADPLAMASITSQVFLGVRIGCAQCHDHPFDVWKRRDFYDMAAYFGKTRRYESNLTNVVYATEGNRNAILWPPEGEAPDAERKPIPPRFPFTLDESKDTPNYIKRLQAVRLAKAEAARPVETGPSVDDLLATSAEKVAKTTAGELPVSGVTAEAKSAIRKIDVQADLYRRSELREQLGQQITDPRNRYFSRSLVNRVWKTLVGRGFVEPVDDFREDNPPVHPQAMDYLAEEFVASDFDLRTLVKFVVLSDAYQRGHAPSDAVEPVRMEMEANLLATPMRRMHAESLYDSIVTAGHLFETKHSPGKNEKAVYDIVRVPKKTDGKPEEPKAAAALLAANNPAEAMPAAMAGNGRMAAGGSTGGYALETAIELDFTALLNAKDEEEVTVDAMNVVSPEQLEAMRMMRESNSRGRMEYEEKRVKRIVDDNPVFATAQRMQSPAPNGHFLRVFGQPNRSDLGDMRDDSASMRQALMMLNGRITHEAARVGDLEPIYKQLSGKDVDIPAAIKRAYLEILTRRPTAQELAEAEQIVTAGPSPLDGMADLRWVLLNCNEFRFLP